MCDEVFLLPYSAFAAPFFLSQTIVLAPCRDP